MTIAIDGVQLNKKLRIGLFDSIVPKTADNFYQLCVNKYYNNTPFHRIIPNFMIQGGDFTRGDGKGGTAFRYKQGDPNKIPDENFFVRHDVHVLSMANSGPNTNGSQFFITLVNTTWLNGKHVVFARLINSQVVADAVTSTMAKYGSKTGKTSKPVTLVKCEEVKNIPVKQVIPAVQSYSNVVKQVPVPVKQVSIPVKQTIPVTQTINPFATSVPVAVKQTIPPVQQVSPITTYKNDHYTLAMKQYEIERQEQIKKRDQQIIERNKAIARREKLKKQRMNIYMNHR